MNKFVIFVCASVLLSCANARPDLSLGYRYNQGHSSGGGGGGFLQAPGGSSYSPVASGNSYFANGPSVGQVGNSGYADGSPNFVSAGPSFNGGNTQFNSGYTPQTSPQYVAQQGFAAPIVSKHFYIHTAPADDDNQEVVRHIQIGQPQKNYRVVFIDTPSSNSAKAKIIADVAPTEEKTAIYVLSKKQNALDISAEVVTPAPVNNKPEVFFIKYKTPEEAIHAQHTIQAQYDALGGSSNVSNEGQIPVSSVIGSLDGPGGHGGNGGNGGDGIVDTIVNIPHTGINTQQTYLPANHRYRVKK